MKGFRLTLVVLAFLAIALAPSAAAQSGITPHFEAWLSSQGYGGYDFARGDVTGGSYGGKMATAIPSSISRSSSFTATATAPWEPGPSA